VVFRNADEDYLTEVVGPDLAHPSGNFTGVALKYRELSIKRLELARALLPKAKRVAVVTTTRRTGRAMESLKAAGKPLGLEVAVCDVSAHGIDDPSIEAGNRALASTLQEMLKMRPDATWRTHPSGRRIASGCSTSSS
jgi:hypothetical protein